MKSIAGTAELNATTFHYEMAGIGPPVVLIHAGIADSRMWEGQFAPLSRWFRVVRYDMRGFGLTPPAEGVFSHTGDLAALLRHLGIARVSLVGCSMGSKTALDFALAYPEQVDRLVLTSPAVSGLPYDGPPPPQAEELDAADAAGDLARVNELEMQIWIDGPYRTPDDVDPGLRALVAEMNAIALANEGIGEELSPSRPAAGRVGDVNVPVLVINGGLDALRTRAAADWLAAELPDTRRIVMSGLTHLPNMERPEEYNRLVVEFLQGYL
ncbi:MAG TPA: alpha/beta hydrolase [Promineifilum sp.]|nr:alpha/beta hydrolase [Promineifilum sp.]HRO91457.1 alpha/beta hydrolase [Promineifilum sp.]HRQ13796.1 alpha/beta hydrolase [Promineifilum sp.]